MSTTARHRESLPVMSTWLARCLPEVGRPLPLLRHILQAFSLCYVLSTGTELCTVVESMFSFETLFEIQGDPVFGIPHLPSFLLLTFSLSSVSIALCTHTHSLSLSLSPLSLSLSHTHTAERAEKLAYNALPATITPDMWAHQYLQQSNEMNAVPSLDHVWTHDGPDATLYVSTC